MFRTIGRPGTVCISRLDINRIDHMQLRRARTGVVRGAWVQRTHMPRRCLCVAMTTTFEHFEHTMLAGELTDPPADDRTYRVRYRSLLRLERRHPWRTILITFLCVLVEVV